MKSTVRLDHALQKLYRAFHSNSLNPECAQQCAVGNILDNTDAWKHLSDHHGAMKLNYVGLVHQNFGRKFNGYTPQELLEIEIAFLTGCGFELPLRANGRKPKKPTETQTLFKGLESVVNRLCRLEGISPLMDIAQLFSPTHKSPSIGHEVSA